MEVHHHPQVEKKSFKEYRLEFVMIFLAVTLGFFAENIRERVADHSKEKEYILSMIEDAATDTVNIGRAVAKNRERDEHLNSLANLCIDYNPNYRKFSFIRNHFTITDRDTSYRLLSRNKVACMEFGNRVLLYAGVVNFYNTRLLEMKGHAVACYIVNFYDFGDI